MRSVGSIVPNPNPTLKYTPKKAVPKKDDPAFNEFVEFCEAFKPPVNLKSHNCGVTRKP